MRYNMSLDFKNKLYVPYNGCRVMRAINSDREYYDVVINGGSSYKDRDEIAKRIRILSGYFDKFASEDNFEWEEIILATYKDGKLSTNNGEQIVSHFAIHHLDEPYDVIRDVVYGLKDPSTASRKYVTIHSTIRSNTLDENTLDIIDSELMELE